MPSAPLRSWRVAAIGLLALALMLAMPAASGRASSGAFTREELEKLANGGLVVRSTDKRRDGRRYIGGSSWQVINAPPSVIWQALLDTEHYPRMMPQVNEARLIKKNGTQRIVFVRHKYGLIDTSYYLKIELDKPRGDIRFQIDDKRPHGLRSAYGLYAIRRYKGGRSLLAYSIKADIGTGLLAMLIEPLVHEWMLKVPWTVKRFVEGSGRWIYDFDSAAL